MTEYNTHLFTKTYSTVTTIYNTKVESKVESHIKTETVPVV
jgi:hypothetical protein